MARYRVSYGGKWQRDFDRLEDAIFHAELEARHRDEIVFVAKQGLLWPRFVAAFPEEHRDLAAQTWRSSRAIFAGLFTGGGAYGGDFGGGGGGDGGGGGGC